MELRATRCRCPYRWSSITPGLNALPSEAAGGDRRLGFRHRQERAEQAQLGPLGHCTDFQTLKGSMRANSRVIRKYRPLDAGLGFDHSGASHGRARLAAHKNRPLDCHVLGSSAKAPRRGRRTTPNLVSVANVAETEGHTDQFQVSLEYRKGGDKQSVRALAWSQFRTNDPARRIRILQTKISPPR
jgi:hypothetical protein